jgi:hypothetical protein
MAAQYQLVLFNVDRPAEPSQAKQMMLDKSKYEQIKSGWIKDFLIGDMVYAVVSWRAFDITSELFGTRHMLIIDVKKK